VQSQEITPEMSLYPHLSSGQRRIQRLVDQFNADEEAWRTMAVKLAELERKIASHDDYSKALIDAIRQLMAPPEAKKRKIGFLVKEKAARYG